MLTLTPKAVTAINRFIRGSDKPVIGLRVLISGGGCSGLQYGMKLESEKAEDDWVMEVDGVTLIVDALSAPLLEGVSVDFIDTLTHTGFKFNNPNATAQCSCGQSFSA